MGKGAKHATKLDSSGECRQHGTRLTPMIGLFNLPRSREHKQLPLVLFGMEKVLLSGKCHSSILAPLTGDSPKKVLKLRKLLGLFGSVPFERNFEHQY